MRRVKNIIITLGFISSILLVSGCCCCTGSQNYSANKLTPTPFIDPIIGTWKQSGANLYYQADENGTFYSYLSYGTGYDKTGVIRGAWNSSGGNFYQVTWDGGESPCFTPSVITFFITMITWLMVEARRHSLNNKIFYPYYFPLNFSADEDLYQYGVQLGDYQDRSGNMNYAVVEPKGTKKSARLPSYFNGMDQEHLTITVATRTMWTTLKALQTLPIER